uniref:Uncharacterized protein n=1 Tax=Sphaerodactylus townsendi TaxID=933632 RepID=A0ACB8GAV6_9SAUR
MPFQLLLLAMLQKGWEIQSIMDHLQLVLPTKSSVEWDRVPAEYKNYLHQNKNDGEFWLSHQDFIDNFSSVCICNNVPTFLNYGQYKNEIWSLDMHIIQWPQGSFARGNSGHLFRIAEYPIQVPEPDLKINNAVISLMQKSPNNARNSQLLPIGFVLSTFDSKHAIDGLAEHIEGKQPKNVKQQLSSLRMDHQ